MTEFFEFASAEKLPGTARTISIEETARRIAPLLRRVPITRVADLTPLDTIGLPVYSACTPLARDLTLHLGKGADAVAARTSAIMEAIERASGEVVPPNAIRARFADLGARAVDPAEFDLPADSTYRPDREFDWMEGFDVIRQERVLIPVDLTITPPREGLLVDADTNGLASGNLYLEAVVHGLQEIIERDCVSEIEFASLFADPHDMRPTERAIDPRTLPGAAREWVTRAEEGGLEVIVHDITNDLDVPTYRTYVLDHHYPVGDKTRTMAFFGMGTSLSPAIAVLRSITEAIQARLGTIQAARDSFNVSRSRPRTTTHLARLRRLAQGPKAIFEDRPINGDLLGDLTQLLAALTRAGFSRCIITNHTRPDLGVPVVRVRVPGLSVFCLNMRRVGMRCKRWLV